MIETVFSVSDDFDPLAGVGKVVDDCREQLGSRIPPAGNFFTSCLDVDYSQMLAEIHTAFPDIELIGCTTDGEITQRAGFSEDSSALLIISADHIRFAASIAENISEDSGSSVEKGFRQAKDKLADEPTLALVLPDGMSTLSVPIDAILRSVMGESLPIFGGSAGDGLRLKQTFQFQGERVFTNAMPILLLAGALDMAVDIAIGPQPHGDFYPVDKADGNVIYRIDGVKGLAGFYGFARLSELLEHLEGSANKREYRTAQALADVLSSHVNELRQQKPHVVDDLAN